MLSKLPKAIQFCHHEIDVSHEVALNRLSDYRFQGQDKWSNKRRHEFFSGRWCAAQCLKQHASSEVDVLIADDRSPVWPNNFLGSISHSNSHAAALVGNKREYKAMGLDIQPPSTPELASELKNMILTHNELSQFWNNDSNKNHEIFDLIFSAKETLFKALYPSCQIYFEHHSAEAMNLDYDKQELIIKLLVPLGTAWKAGSLFTIHFQKLKGELISWMFIAKASQLPKIG